MKIQKKRNFLGGGGGGGGGRSGVGLVVRVDVNRKVKFFKKKN